MESIDWAVWGPPLLVLAVGAVAGVTFALRAGERLPTRGPRDDLLARKQVLMESLRELEADRPKLDDADYMAQKSALVNEAAEVLQRLDSPSLGVASPAPAGRRGAGWAWALGLVVFFALAGVLLQKAIVPRTGGGSMTGNQQLGGDARVVAAQAALAKDPNDIQALNLLTRAAIEEQNFESAMQWQDRARAINPEDPGVLTHYAALLVVIGRFEEAQVQARAALSRDPAYHEARLWLALCQGNLGDLDGAESTLREVLADANGSAEDRANASALLGSLMAARAQGQAGPPTEAPPVAAGPPKASGQVVSAQPVAPGGVLYVYARTTEAPSGRPLAAKRFAEWSLPLDFSLSESDLIMGGAWPEQVWLSARVVRSGDPMKRSPDDVEAAPVGPLAPGAEGVQLNFAP